MPKPTPATRIDLANRGYLPTLAGKRAAQPLLEARDAVLVAYAQPAGAATQTTFTTKAERSDSR